LEKESSSDEKSVPHFSSSELDIRIVRERILINHPGPPTRPAGAAKGVPRLPRLGFPVLAQWESSGRNARREVSVEKVSVGWGHDLRAEVGRTVDAKKMGGRSGSSSDEDRQPPFGIEKANIEGNRGRSFPRTTTTAAAT
jgi:hypothetical protein